MPTRLTDNLHRGRRSIPFARYFVTCCTAPRRTDLLTLVGQLHRTVFDSDENRDSDTLAMTVMPDHLHWLFTLGERLAVGQVLGRLKTSMRAALDSKRLNWQRDYFEHRLRSDESSEEYAFYIFMNPYRAGLTTTDWPGWYCPRIEQFDFSAHLDVHGKPPREWIDRPVPPGIRTGD